MNENDISMHENDISMHENAHGMYFREKLSWESYFRHGMLSHYNFGGIFSFSCMIFSRHDSFMHDAFRTEPHQLQYRNGRRTWTVMCVALLGLPKISRAVEAPMERSVTGARSCPGPTATGE